jgi:hypothetical protein
MPFHLPGETTISILSHNTEITKTEKTNIPVSPETSSDFRVQRKELSRRWIQNRNDFSEMSCLIEIAGVLVSIEQSVEPEEINCLHISISNLALKQNTQE